jgi:cyclic dehypoxanthinyl futalosine synthase
MDNKYMYQHITQNIVTATLQRISNDAALDLYNISSVHTLYELARGVTNTIHPTQKRTYVVERNINYTNVCLTGCKFCAFQRNTKSKDAYALSDETIAQKIQALTELGGTQILLQGGLNPDLPLEWYQNMLSEIKNNFPHIHIHGFSPEEIFYFSSLYDKTVIEILEIFRKAGLDSIPGAGGEILVDRVRDIIARQKCNTEQWLGVMRDAHTIGMCTSATMMFGHVETPAERIEHLQRVRELQDESLERHDKDNSCGIFTAFICWPFQPGGTPLGKFDKYDRASTAPRGDIELLLGGPFEQLKMTALARVYLDNIKNIQASWVTQGQKMGQISLMVGCNDMGSLMMEENVVSAVGTTYEMNLEALRDLIKTSGYIPIKRDYYYTALENKASTASISA